MKYRIILLVACTSLFCACSKDNGYTENVTSDGIMMQVDYSTSFGFFSGEEMKADVTVSSQSTADVGASAIYIDGHQIQSIPSVPWHKTFLINMLNKGDHEFWLVHTTLTGSTDTLVSRFFI